MNKTSCACTPIGGLKVQHLHEDWVDEATELLKSFGDFFWIRDAAGEPTHICLAIPGNEGGSVVPIPVVRGAQTEEPFRWGWDGNEEHPTLAPSIWRNRSTPEHPNVPNEWHGMLENGQLRSSP